MVVCLGITYVPSFQLADVHNAEFILTGVLTQELNYDLYPSPALITQSNTFFNWSIVDAKRRFFCGEIPGILYFLLFAS